MTVSSVVIVSCVTSCLVSLASTAIVRSYAIRARLIDTPNDRSSHTVATPRGGGLGILVAATLVVAIGCRSHSINFEDAITLGIGAWAIAVLGWVDDHRGLHAAMRLFVQVPVAFATVFTLGGFPAARAGLWTIHFGWLGYGIATAGLVWAMNLFNFMDGIDALASSQAALILMTTGLLLLHVGDVSLGLIACVLGAAAVGFLPWNWPRAKIFLGDVGSAPIGYLIASIALASENRREVPLLAVMLAAAVFVVDATVTLARRFLRGERLSVAHRSHAYQRLARAFRSHGIVSGAAAVETVLFSIFAVASTLVPALFVAAVFLTGAVLAATLLYAERCAPMSRPPRTG